MALVERETELPELRRRRRERDNEDFISTREEQAESELENLFDRAKKEGEAVRGSGILRGRNIILLAMAIVGIILIGLIIWTLTSSVQPKFTENELLDEILNYMGKESIMDNLFNAYQQVTEITDLSSEAKTKIKNFILDKDNYRYPRQYSFVPIVGYPSDKSGLEYVTSQFNVYESKEEQAGTCIGQVNADFFLDSVFAFCTDSANSEKNICKYVSGTDTSVPTANWRTAYGSRQADVSHVDYISNQVLLFHVPPIKNYLLTPLSQWITGDGEQVEVSSSMVYDIAQVDGDDAVVQYKKIGETDPSKYLFTTYGTAKTWKPLSEEIIYTEVFNTPVFSPVIEDIPPEITNKELFLAIVASVMAAFCEQNIDRLTEIEIPQEFLDAPGGFITDLQSTFIHRAKPGVTVPRQFAFIGLIPDVQPIDSSWQTVIRSNTRQDPKSKPKS